MDKRDALKSMLNNIINDKGEEASLDLHNYLTAKMKEVAGLGQQEAPASTDEIRDGDYFDDDDTTGASA